MTKTMGEYLISKQRVADHGEVYTRKREVNAMLDLVKQVLVFFLNGHLFADYIEQVDKFPDYFDRRYFRLA
jgi:hypothetical protein